MTTNLISYVGGSQEATWVQLRNEQHSQYQLDYSADNVHCVATKSNVNGGDPCRNGLNFDNHSALQLVKRAWSEMCCIPMSMEVFLKGCISLNLMPYWMLQWQSPTMTFIKDTSHWVQVPGTEKSGRYIIVEWSRGIEITEDLNCVPDSNTERYTPWNIGVACSVEPYSQTKTSRGEPGREVARSKVRVKENGWKSGSVMTCESMKSTTLAVNLM